MSVLEVGGRTALRPAAAERDGRPGRRPEVGGGTAARRPPRLSVGRRRDLRPGGADGGAEGDVRAVRRESRWGSSAGPGGA